MKSQTQKWHGEIPITSQYTAGVAGQIFLAALKERGELLGSRCAPCNQVYVPARQFCERCFAELSERVSVKTSGTLKSFTCCHVDHDGKQLRAPQFWALVQLDGATTLFLHRLLGVTEPAQIKLGSRVELLIKPKTKRAGSILDIEGFRIA
ncbi:MAG TPA: Zn-ribbon domain-containing OB-fold protein [Candidatus Acidoferrales bacterium]|nr:Zn-ribbon domain-containing OB-fold protein [Candidatus Acidoferrales bacterium]